MTDRICGLLAGPLAVVMCKLARRSTGVASTTSLAAATLALMLALPADTLGQTTTTTLPIPSIECISDLQGADDEPGQKDLNEFCKKAPGVDDDFDLQVSWNFDDVFWSGSNTGDACVLFDSDGNDFADFALCVTVEGGPPATQVAGSPRLHMCGNDRPDRCSSSVEDTDGFSSHCVVNVPGQDADPFMNDPDHVGGTPCKGTDCELEDAFITCWLETDDIPGDEVCVANACTNIPSKYCFEDTDCIPITDVCSYPSNQPGSDPSDCILTPTAQDPCKNIDCTHLDSECMTGVCQSSDKSCIAEPKSAGTICGDPSNSTCDHPDSCDGAGTCQPNYEISTTICRDAVGECDVAETCDGSGSCPEDGFADVGVSCGDTSDGNCDNPDTCDGSGACLPNYEISITICRDAVGECDIPETCDGAGSCPVDSFVNAGVGCGDPTDNDCENPDTCDGSGSCLSNYESSDTTCREAVDDCDVAETCDGAGSCPEDSFANIGSTCGDQTDDDCENPDTCDGSGVCLPNYESSDTTCREAVDACDIAETCDGAGSCPDNSFADIGATCGDQTDDDCENPDTCDGSGVCLPNYESSDTTCREAVDACDVAETCDGAGSCPENSFAEIGSTCGDQTDDVCENPDTCDGSGVCLPNYESSDTTCREAVNDCDVAETCDGAGSCPEDGLADIGAVCGDQTDDVCENPDTCDGSGVCLPNHESSDTTCREAVDACDVAETCDGAGSCPENSFAEIGSTCGDQTDDVCENPDTCDGSGVCLPNYESSETTCREAVDDCDIAETCDGAGSCPENSFAEIGATCGDQTDDICENPNTCDGSGVCLPNYESPDTVCRKAAGDCDIAENCDGAGSCPDDVFLAAETPCGDGTETICNRPDICDGAGTCKSMFMATTTVCREAVDDCDVLETCNGVGVCPEDNFQDDGATCDDGEICTGPDQCLDGICEGAPIQPTLTVVKEVINEIRGTLEADDFRFLLDDGTTITEFRVEADTIDPTMGSITFDIDHGVPYEVTELLGDLADFYEVSYAAECSGETTCVDPAKFCVVTNDDIYRNQASIAFRSITVAFVEEDDSRMHLEGEFRITDESEGGDEPDGWIVLLDDYAIDWQHRHGDDSDWEPSYHAGQDGGSLEIDGVLTEYVCTYEVVDVDGSVPELEGYQSGDPVPFDEEITISYICWFDTALPEDGVLRAIATTGIFAKSGHQFLSRRSFALDGSGMLPEEPEPEPDPETDPEPLPDPESDPEPLPDPETDPEPEPQPPPWTCDDPSADGISSASDALYVLRAALGMHGPDGTPPNCPHEFCDQNCDNELTATDALVSLKRGLGLLKKAGKFCCE